MTRDGESVFQEIRSLTGAPIIALTLVYVDSTVSLSWYQLVIVAVAVSILFHGVIPSSVERLRKANDA